MNLTNFYKALSIVSLFAVATAVAGPYGWAVYKSLSDGMPNGAAAIMAFAAFVALEAVGMRAGKLAVDLHGVNDDGWYFAGAVLALYMTIGMIELWGTSAQLFPLLAVSAYVLEGQQVKSDEIKRNKEQQRQERRADRKEARQLKVAERKRSQVAPQPARNPHQPQRKLTARQAQVLAIVREQPEITDTQLGKRLGVSRQAAAQHRKKLNGLASKGGNGA